MKYGRHTMRCMVTVFALTLGAMAEIAQANNRFVQTLGQAFDLKSKQPLYNEIHCLSNDALTREVIYRDTEGQLIAHKILSYRTGPITPSFIQQNFYSRESVAIELKDNELTLTTTRQDRQESQKVVSIQPSAELPVVIDAGFDAFVTRHWDRLIAGESKNFQFPFAAHESMFELRLRSANCNYDTTTDQCFILEMNNWLIRMLVDPIELGYDVKLRRLSRYRGLSNIGDASGEGLVVDIRYDYKKLPNTACKMSEM